MLASCAELVPDDMADILYPMSTSGASDMAAWPTSYESADGHESAWRYQGPSPYAASEDMSQSNMHEQAWSTYSVSPGLGGFPHLQSSPDLVHASHQLSGNEVMSFEQVPHSTDSSNTLHDPYQSNRFFSPRDTISSDTRPPNSSTSLNTSAALASAAALRKREQSLYSPLDGIESARQHPYQSAQPVARQRDQRSASLKVPPTTVQQGAGRATRSNSASSIQLQDEERLLIHLKEEKSLTWKEIAQRFQSDLGISYQIPALQMRYKRLKEKIRVWSKSDLEALRQARDYWETKKWEIISNKVSLCAVLSLVLCCSLPCRGGTGIILCCLVSVWS